jgi:branched-chain amino acid transport system ATP-binding protein
MSLLEGRGIAKRFGGLNAVEDLTFALETGEIVGLIGPNGAGKTTLVNVITGLLPIDAGTVQFKGRSIDRLRAHERNRLGIARTFQIVRPFRGLTVVDNVLAGALFGRADAGRDRARPAERTEAVLEMVGLSAKARLVAEQLTVADKKRVELARALATRPEVLLLDEVMSGLTPTEVDEMIGLVRRVNRSGVTILLIEHVMRAVMSISDRILVLQNGRKLAEGDPASVAGNPAVIAAYLGRRAEPA